jgi:hypothetical protein
MSGGPSLGLFAPDIEQRDLELEVAHCVRGVVATVLTNTGPELRRVLAQLVAAVEGGSS